MGFPDQQKSWPVPLTQLNIASLNPAACMDMIQQIVFVSFLLDLVLIKSVNE